MIIPLSLLHHEFRKFNINLLMDLFRTCTNQYCVQKIAKLAKIRAATSSPSPSTTVKNPSILNSITRISSKYLPSNKSLPSSIDFPIQPTSSTAETRATVTPPQSSPFILIRPFNLRGFGPTGVYRIPSKDLYIDINGVAELQRTRKTKETLILGGGVTLEHAKEAFQKYSNDEGFEYLERLADHMDLIGHVSLRNVILF